MSNNKLRAALFAIAVLFCLAFPGQLKAQCASYTQVTATVVDPLGIPYSTGSGSTASVVADLFPSGGTPTCNPASGGTRPQFSTHQGPTPLDANGSFTMQLPPNSIIQPGGTQWTFTVSENPGVYGPLGYGPISFQVTITISGATQNITTTLNAAAPVLSRVGASSGGPGLTYLGMWNSTTAYVINNVVTYGGSSYVAVAPSTGVTPGTNSTIWQVFAQAGQNGTNGLNGLNGAPGFSPNSLIAGCGIEWTGGLNFTIGACQYIINNVQYNSPLTNVTLPAADPTNPELDVFYVDNTGAAGVIQGTPSATPLAPSVDISTQIQVGGPVLLNANATAPAQVTKYDIFHECVEWTVSTNQAGQINICSTNNPYDGTKDVEATAAARNTYVQFTNGTTVDLATTNTLVFYLRSKATWSSTRSLVVQWYNGNSAKSTQVIVGDGQFGFTSSNTSGYQQIAIPTSLFQINGVPVNRVRLTVSGPAGSATIGFYLDDITLQAGTGLFSIPNNIMLFSGNWNAAASYVVNDVVISGGESWIALAPNANSQPSVSNSNWQDLGPALPLSVANGGTGGASYTAHSVLVGEGTNPINATCVNALTGQVLTAVNGSDPACQSQGVPDGNGAAPVTSTPYTVQCDSSTTTLDRGTTIRFQPGASVINMPDSTGPGCGSNLYITLINDGAGTLTVNRSGSDTFTVVDGSTNTDSATSFTFGTGQSVSLNNGASLIWNARKFVQATGGITQAYQTIEVNGTPVTQRSTENYIPVGSTNVNCVDNSAQTRTDCSITGANPAPSPQVNSISAASYTVPNSDNSFRDIFTNGTVAVTLPQAGTITVSPFNATKVQAAISACSSCTTSTFSQSAGDTLVVQVSWRFSSGNPIPSGTPPITDTAGDTFVRAFADQLDINDQGSSNFSQSVWIVKSAIASASNAVTFNLSATPNQNAQISVIDYTTTAIDNGASTFAQNAVSLSIPNTYNPELTIAAATGAAAVQCPTGWTQRALVSLSGTNNFVCDQVFASPQSTIFISANSFTPIVGLANFQVAGTASFLNGWYALFENDANSGIVTITPTTSHIFVNGVSSTTLQIGPHQACSVMSDGANYQAACFSLVQGLAGAIALTGQTASISTATLCGALPNECGQAGTYTVRWNFVQDGTACGTPSTGGVTFLFTWTDSNGTAHSAVSLPMDDATAITSLSQTFHFQTTNAAAWASGQFNFDSNGTVVQYGTGYTACGTGTGSYRIKASVSRLQ